MTILAENVYPGYSTKLRLDYTAVPTFCTGKMCIVSKKHLTPPACWFPPQLASLLAFLETVFTEMAVFDRFRWNSRIFVARGVEKGPLRQAGGHLGMWSENYSHLFFYLFISDYKHNPFIWLNAFFFSLHFWQHAPMNFMSVLFIYLCSVLSFHLMKLNKESSAFHFIFRLLGCWIF